MADKPKKRIIQKSETVREKAARAGEPKPKRRVLRTTAGKVTRPLKALAPAVKPFKTKPVRTTAKVVGWVVWPVFFRGAWRELRQVEWPSRKETWKLTSAVFIFAIVFGLIIAITDFGLDKLFKKVILK